MYVYMCMCIDTYIYMHIYTGVDVYTHAHTHIRPYIPYMHTYIQTYIHRYIHVSCIDLVLGVLVSVRFFRFLHMPVSWVKLYQ